MSYIDVIRRISASRGKANWARRDRQRQASAGEPRRQHRGRDFAAV